MSATPSAAAMGMLIDTTLCGGCYQCVAACMKAHNFPGEPESVRDLSDKAYTCVAPVGDLNVRNMCRHCVSPSCASVCPVGALAKSPLGPVTYDAGKCIGCRYCMLACPFNIPRYEWHERVPALQKCNMCVERIEAGAKPACAEACPSEATLFGPRAELIDIAHKRIADSPKDYYDHVYGEREIGGTSILFLTPKPIEQLGYRESLGTEPLPDLTDKQVKRVPAIVVAGGAALTAFWLFTRRRDEVSAHESRDRTSAPDAHGDGDGRANSHDAE